MRHARLLVILLAVMGVVSAATAPSRPNFLFVYTDDQRFDAMGVVQREQGERARFPWFKTPAMDRIAGEGVRFRNAFVTLSLCAPSRAAFLTSRYNHLNGVINNETPFPVESVTHASLMRDAGYQTAYIGKWHMAMQRGQRPGFTYSASFVGQGKYPDCAFEINGVETPTKGWVDDVSTDYAIEFMKKNRDKPFSMVVGFKTPHVPLIPPERAKDRFAGEQWRSVPNLNARAIYRDPPGAKETPWEKRPTNLNYFRCISAIDDCLGRMLDALDELGLAENTVVVFTSDNGYYQGEHMLGDKRSAYDESLRIPLVVRYPKLFPKGKVVDEMVLNLDLAPTFLDLAGVKTPAEMQGRSWAPLVANNTAGWRKAFLYEYFLETQYPTTPTVLAVRTDTAKLIKYPGRDDWTELFDLKNDPYELKNLVRDPAHAALLKAMQAEFEQQQKATAFRMPDNVGKAPEKPAPSSATPPLPPSPPQPPAPAQPITSLKNPASAASVAFIDQHCASCHDENEKEGGLDLTALAVNLGDPKNYAAWVKVHDRVVAGEMPPKKKGRPQALELETFVGSLNSSLTNTDRERSGRDGRATQRRLNRYEYENALRDLLQAPWLQVKDRLPEDGEVNRFNKISEALDVSYVQMARYIAAADYALRQVVATQVERPPTPTTRYYARDQKTFSNKMTFSFFNMRAERATFPVLGTKGQPEVRTTKQPLTVGPENPAVREQEAMGTVASSYEPIELRFEKFKAPVAGRYRLRLNAYSVWAGAGKPVPGKPDRWWIPDLNDISPGRRPEPITLYSETPPRQLRWLGAIDVGTEPTVNELDVQLLANEMIRVDAARLFRSRPSNWVNPLATHEGQPGVAFKWLEVEGPIYDAWPTAGHKLLFGDLPLKSVAKPGAGELKVEVVSTQPKADAERLLRGFMNCAYRQPVLDADVKRFLPVIESALATGSGFGDAMIAGYTAVLCSPAFVCLEETPGPLNDYAVGARLAFFLWNSEPDAELRALAARGELRRPEVLRAQTERLLNDPKSRRFVDAFLDYWLDLRRIQNTSPDSTLYSDYNLDDLLTESAQLETQLFFSELLRTNLPASTLVSSDFVMVNERLAQHYGLAGVDGVGLRRVKLPPESPRGGLLTQASVLKVTANGTTTSPVLRGAWIMERILGLPPPPPPPSVPAVEPDIRGATTIRQLLDKHRNETACATCHTKIDPAGFALENFDVMGGWRDRYRAVSDGVPAEPGLGKGGLKFAFHYGLPVDASGELPDGRKFSDVRDFKRLLLTDETQIARNLARQLTVYATGAPIRFGDRAAIEAILQRAAASRYGVRSLVHEIVQSELFLNK